MNCVHGVNIGTPGGRDLMCGWCEDSISKEEFDEFNATVALTKIRDRAFRTEMFLAYLLTTGTGGIEASRIVATVN